MIYKEINIKINHNCLGKTSNVVPKLYVYLPSNSAEIDSSKKRKTILICPGGGYHFTSDREAEPIALKLIAEGYNAFILRYSCAPASFPTALCELATSISLIRENKVEWNIDVNKIIIAGFSAGGHLAGSLATLWHTDFLEEQTGLKKGQYQPNGLMLGYPVVTTNSFSHIDSFRNLLQNSSEFQDYVSLEKNISSNMPSTFIWHTDNDSLVPVENSLLLATELKKHKIPLELHIFPDGVHGLSLATDYIASPTSPELINTRCQVWFDLFLSWLKEL